MTDDSRYTGERMKALQAEMQHDSGLAHLRDREVKYEDAETPNAEFKAMRPDTTDPPDYVRQSYIPAVLGNADAKELAAELDQIKSATYVESEIRVAGWNYEPGDGGLAFNDLPVTDREVMIEDYVDWGKYMERGLTFEDQGRIMYYAARDVAEARANSGESAHASDFGRLPVDLAQEPEQPSRIEAFGRLTADVVVDPQDHANRVGMDGFGEVKAVRDRLPSPSEIARDKRPYRPEPWHDRGQEKGRGGRDE